MVPLPPPTPTPAILPTAPSAATTTATAAAAATCISSNGLVVTLMGSMNSLLALWKKKGNKTQSTKTKKLGENLSLAKPKKFLAKIKQRIKAKNDEEKKKVENDDEDFGDGGLWQKEILMGDKCQPLDFSGVIYYDRNGKKLSEVPVKSPRASPMPSYLNYGSSKSEELK